jgi:hypothetical protein
MPNSSQSSESLESEDINFFVVLISEFDAPQLLRYSTPQEAASRIREYKLEHKQFYAYVFEGKQWKHTNGPSSYLLSPDADLRLPLFDDGSETINETGLFS